MDNHLFDEVFKLKNLLRRGWVLRDIPNRTESDAEHCYSMIMLALEIFSKNDLKLDQLKVLKLIAYHELGEIDAGDTTPVDNVSKEEKHKQELEGVKRIAETYEMPEQIFASTDPVNATEDIMYTLHEKFRNEDGSVNIPKALRPYMGGKEKLIPTV